MLEETTPDSVPNSFRSDETQKSGSTDVQRTSENCTIADIQNQAIPEIVAGQGAHSKKVRKPGRFAGTGNRCAHKPEVLRDIPFKAEARRPIVIQQMLR